MYYRLIMSLKLAIILRRLRGSLLLYVLLMCFVAHTAETGEQGLRHRWHLGDLLLWSVL